MPTTNAPAAHSPRSALFTTRFVAVLAATFAYFVSFTLLLPVLPVYVDVELGGGTAAVGATFGSFFLVALALRPWAGGIGDRRGRRVLLVGGATVAGIATAGCLAAQSLAVLLALRGLAGAGEAMFFVGAATAAQDLAPAQRRGEALSFFSLAPYTALIVGPALGNWLLGTAGPDAVWVVSGALALLAAGVAAGVGETRPEGLRPAQVRGLHPAAVRPAAILLASILGLGAFNAFVPLHADAIGLVNPAAAFALFGGTVVAVRVFGARIPDIVGPARAARGALCLGCLGLAAIAVVQEPVGLLGGAIVLGAGQALAFPSLMAMATAAAPPSERAAVVGTMTMSVDVAFGAGPIVLGALAATAGVAAAFAGAALVAACALALLIHCGSAIAPVPAPAAADAR